jgi:hypothetical protein
VRPARALAGLAVALAAAGCAVPGSAASLGDQAATDQAVRIGHWLDNRPRAMHESLSLARAVLGEPGWRGTEVLSAAGDRRDGSVELLLRFSLTGPYSGYGSEATTVVRCRLIVQSGVYGSFVPAPADCPDDAQAITPPPADPDPTLPAGFDDRLAAALRGLRPADRSDRGEVEAAAWRVLAGVPARVSSANVNGTVGLAVSVSGDRCVLAVVGEKTEVWRPSRVSVQPGEGGCSAATAAMRR